MACPCCFSMMFRDSKFCPNCGAPSVPWEATTAPLPCPRCQTPLLKATVGGTQLYQCNRCFGFWVDRTTLEAICRDANKHAIAANGATGPQPSKAHPVEKVRYVRCPGCRALMNRVNFAEYSGIVVDVCREHGTWFDVDELQRVVHFLRDGGMDKVRDRQQAELESARRRLLAAKSASARMDSLEFPADRSHADGLPEVLRLVGSLFGRNSRK